MFVEPAEGEVRRIWAAIAASVVGLGAMPIAILIGQQGPVAPAMNKQEATALTQGWALLAQGLLDEAVASSEATLRRYPKNQAALALVVEVTVARVGARQALDRYEAWLGTRTMDDAYVLRRIARAVLWEAARQPDGAGRYEALKALLGDGDEDAAAELTSGMEQGNLSDTQIMAALGNGPAVQRLIDRMNSNQPMTTGMIAAMGESRQSLAVAPLVSLLKDPRPAFRAAAARGLGTIQAREASAPLRTLLQDMLPEVRLQAAASLWLMDDASGLEVLRQFEDSEHPAVRLAALEATNTKRDGGWNSRARALLQSEDAMVRVQAATLLAPDDPQAAREVLDALASHENIGIREAAEKAVSGASGGDLRTLRRFLRSGNPATRVSAAVRVLEQVR